MKNQLTFIVGIVIVIILLTYMLAYTVRYDQVAVVTTFDRAAAPQVDPTTGELSLNPDGTPVDPGSVKTAPGLYPKWPWPIQKVYLYPRSIQILEDQLEQQNTSDNFSVVIRTYLAWRIEDPLSFFVRLKNTDNADKLLLSLMRDMRGIIGRYRFDQLVNTDANQLMLTQIEKETADQIQQKLVEGNYGIKVEQVGIRRIVLPESVTQKVFERMKATRQRLAADIKASGNAQAAAIRSEAKSIEQRILAFAQRRAQTIRAEGDREAAQFYREFAKDESLAIFLRQIDAMRKTLANNTTFVLDAARLSPIDLLTNEPGSEPATNPNP